MLAGGRHLAAVSGSSKRSLRKSSSRNNEDSRVRSGKFGLGVEQGCGGGIQFPQQGSLAKATCVVELRVVGAPNGIPSNTSPARRQATDPRTKCGRWRKWPASPAPLQMAVFGQVQREASAKRGVVLKMADEVQGSLRAGKDGNVIKVREDAFTKVRPDIKPQTRNVARRPKLNNVGVKRSLCIHLVQPA